MLGIMADPPVSPAEADESQERVLKTPKTQSKNGTITDFFKSPTQKPTSTPLNKPANLLGYFSSQKSPSSDNPQQYGKQVPSKTIESAPKKTDSALGEKNQKKSDKKTVRPAEGKKASKKPKQSGSHGDKDRKNTGAHLEGLISQLNRGRTERGSVPKGKRKKAASPNVSSADDFESPPPAQKSKRPKVELTKQGSKVARKVFSLSDSTNESRVECQYDLASLAGGGSDTGKVQKGSKERPNLGCSKEDRVGNIQSGGSSSAARKPESAGLDQKGKGNIPDKEGGSERQKNGHFSGSQDDEGTGGDGKTTTVQVISYEDFLNSEMDDCEGSTLDRVEHRPSGNKAKSHHTGRNPPVQVEDSGDDSILLISPGGDKVPDGVGKGENLRAGVATKDDESGAAYSGEYSSDTFIEGVSPLDDDDGVDANSVSCRKAAESEHISRGTYTDGENVLAGDRGRDRSRSEMEQGETCDASAEVSEDSAVEINTPAKSGQVVPLQQTPKLVVKAVVHSPQSGSSQGRLTPRGETPTTPQGRISNVALDDVDNDMSIIQVVKAPTKPLYSIFMKKPKGGKKQGEVTSKKGEVGEGSGKNGDSTDDFEEGPTGKASPRKGGRDGKTRKKSSKSASEVQQKTSPRKRGRPRKIVTDEEESETIQAGEKTENDSKTASGKRSNVRNASSSPRNRKKGRTKGVVPSGAKKDEQHPKEQKRVEREEKREPREKGKKPEPEVIIGSSEEDSAAGRRSLRPRRSAGKEASLREQEGVPTDNVKADRAEEDKEATARKSIRAAARRNGDSIQAKNSTKSVRAQQLLRKAKSQKAQVLGQKSLNKKGKLQLRVTLDPLDVTVKKGQVIVKTSGEEAGDCKKHREEEGNSRREAAAVTKKEAPVKLAAMFTKEGRRSLAKQQQQEEPIEVHTLSSGSSDDESSRDALTVCSVSTPRQLQATGSKEADEEMVAPFPEISHILQREMASGDSYWWNLPAVDQSKLRIRDGDQSRPSLVTDPGAPMEGFTLSHLKEQEIPPIKFTGHPELSYEEQKAALDGISEQQLTGLSLDRFEREGHPELSYEEQKAALERISEANPQFPVRRIFKRYLAKRKGETSEPVKTKEVDPNPKEGAKPTSRKRKPEGDMEASERKVRRSSRGRSVKEQKAKTETKNSTKEGEKDGKSLADDAPKLHDLLWSDKYQPTSAEEVLVGNRSSVNQLNTWLKEWKIRIGRIKKKEAKAMRGNNKAAEDSESDFELSDDDSDSEDDDDSLCNTFLITGQHGVGKTAAVYACAKEMGFKVIEVNASSKRVGRQILDDLGEATQSHQLTGQAGLKTADLARFFKLKTPPALMKPKPPPKPKMPKAFAAFVKAGKKTADDAQGPKTAGKGRPSLKETAPAVTPGKARATPKKPPQGAASTPSRSTQVPLMVGPDRSNTKGASVILFDEVDIVFEEDKGFLHAINTFMASTKRPIILTTSDARFSDSLDGRFEHVKMQRPEMKKLATSMQLLCLAENVRTSQQDMLSLVGHYGNDLRRCLHSLQTWVNTGAMLSSWRPMGTASPTRKVCKLSLKRVKGSKDYACQVKQDQARKEKVMGTSSPVRRSSPTMNRGSVLSLVGCQPDAELNALLLSIGRPANGVSTDDVYSSTRKLLRCGTDPIRRLERKILDRIIPDITGSEENCGRSSPISPSEKGDDSVEDRQMKNLHARSVEELSLYLDNLCQMDLLARKSDSVMGVDNGDKSHWWSSDTYAGLDDLSDNQESGWSLRDFSEELGSVMERENFDLCRRKLMKLRDSFEETGTSDRGAVRSLDVGEELQLNPDPSFDINSLYGAMSRKLPRYAWCSHRSTALEYLPMMRSMCHSERLREGAQLKRRFLHYLDAVSINLKPMEKVRLASIAAHFTWREEESPREEQHSLTMDEDSNMGV